MAPTVLIADADKNLHDPGRCFFSRVWRIRAFGDHLDCLAQLHQFLPQLLVHDSTLSRWADGLLAVLRAGLVYAPRAVLHRPQFRDRTENARSMRLSAHRFLSFAVSSRCLFILWSRKMPVFDVSLEFFSPS